MAQNYLPKDAAEYPKTSATRVAMVEIAQKYIDEYETQLAALSVDEKLQKKLLTIQKNMAANCQMFAMIAYHTDTFHEQLAVRENILSRTDLLKNSVPLSQDERGALVQYVFAGYMLHNAFIDKHIAKLEAAKASGQPEAAFEDRIILGTIYTICREWRAWWLENGTAAFDMWTYEDSPWETEENA